MNGNRGAVVIMIGLAGLFLAVAGASAWQGTARLAGRGSDRGEAGATARAFVEAYGTFDHRDAQGYRERLLGLSTGDLHAAVAESAVDPMAVAQARTLHTTVQSVQVTALAGGDAAATVVAEQQRTELDPATGRLRQTVVRQRVSCRLTQVEGRWLVAEFRLVVEEPGTVAPAIENGG